MKKSTLLSFLTAATVITTTAGTYALWDTVTDETTEVITFRNPVTVNVSEEYTLTETKTLGETPSASGDVSFTISNEDGLATKLKIVPSVSGSDVSIDKFDFEIIDKKDSSQKLSGDKTSGFIDSTLTSTEYTVKVTPLDNSVAGKAATIKLTATLEK